MKMDRYVHAQPEKLKKLAAECTTCLSSNFVALPVAGIKAEILSNTRGSGFLSAESEA